MSIRLRLLCIIVITSSISLSAQKEEPLLTDVLRNFDTQKYEKYLCEDVGSGRPIDTKTNWEERVREVEERIAQTEREVEIKPVEISLVFHFLSTDDREQAQNLVTTQIEALNKDFGEKSMIEKHPNDPDGIYLRLATPTQLLFAPAQVESDFSNGIVTLRRSEQVWKSWDEMKSPEFGGSSGIDQSQFLNIWICNLEESELSSYASNIYQIDQADGIVIDSRFFGTSEEESNYNQGKTLTHLIGSYLGLRELWSESERCADDYVADTPRHNAPNYKAYPDRHVTTCDDHPREMVMNFMDSSPDQLQIMFTQGQVKRLHAALQTLRTELANSSTSVR